MANKISVTITNLTLSKVLPQFLTADEISKRCGMSKERIIQLAEADIIPHARIDNGPPLFLITPTMEWIKENALHVQDGQKLPINLVTVVNKKPDFSEVPEELKGIVDKLRKIDILAYPPCIYFLIREHKVVYVGQTTSLASRIQSHLNDKVFDDVLYLPIPRDNLDEVERQFIISLRPEYNNEGFAKKAKREAAEK